MGLGDCFKCIKYLLFVFNLIFCLLGLAILAFGIFVYVAPQVTNVTQDAVNAFHFVGIFLIVIGSIITILGFLGCCGAIFENRVLLVLFFVVLLLVFLCLLAVGIAAIILKGELRNHLGKQFEEGIRATDNSTERKIVEDLQEGWNCCGWVNAEEEYKQNFPRSCHYNATNPPEPCSKRFKDIEAKYGVWVIVSTFVTAAVALLGLVFSMMLCCSIGDLA